ncbi:EpsG family protein [uncultured Cetobacterium sp.]|uniref:EpsG family protein n=1 Tax=uncultured Cetobacterium sp. TaxID=527638 RepID=UPI002605F181|nr:EpsG family protein [uncultured Cetobacterium sp.]
MAFYIVAIIISLLGLYDVFGKNSQIKNKLLKVVVFFLIVFLGTRGFLGWDWYFYYPSFLNGTYVYEKGYMFFTIFISRIWKNYIFYQFITGSIDLLVFYFVFKRYCKYPILTFAIFFSIQGLQMEVELLRNMKAIVLFLLSLKYIEERKILPFLLLNVLGATFHLSALIYLPMYYILNINYNKKIILSIFILGSFYYIFDLKIFIILLENLGNVSNGAFRDRVLNYKSVLPIETFRGLNMFYLERLILFAVAYFNEKNIILKNSAYIWIFIFLFTSELSIISVRIGILFIYSIWIVLSRAVEIQDIRTKYLVLATIFLLCGFRLHNNLSFIGNADNYRYENIIFGGLDYERREKELKESKKFLKDSHGKELLIQY